MIIRDKTYWDRYPTYTLKNDISDYERKTQLFRNNKSDLSTALTTGIHNKKEYNIVKAILNERGKI